MYFIIHHLIFPVVNNLIVKFVEDDIVLSVNVKSVEYHSVNSIWQKSFIDLTPEDLVKTSLVCFCSSYSLE